MLILPREGCNHRPGAQALLLILILVRPFTTAQCIVHIVQKKIDSFGLLAMVGVKVDIKVANIGHGVQIEGVGCGVFV